MPLPLIDGLTLFAADDDSRHFAIFATPLILRCAATAPSPRASAIFFADIFTAAASTPDY
jgi:hypothetical protein